MARRKAETASGSGWSRNTIMDQILLPRPDMPVEDQLPEVLFAMLIFGEARGEEFAVKCAVGSVVRNRVEHPRWWGHDLKAIILKPFQFSCFNHGDPNREKLLWPLKHEENTVWDECYEIAVGILENDLPDNTGHADHYFDDSISFPKWARQECFTVKMGRLNFYCLEI
jgi:spore germination cell wall hydrolase CwlJ-like protein